MTPYGGQYLARCNDPQVLEGEWGGDQIVIVEFPSAAAAKAWNESPEYRAIARLRTDNTHSTRLLVQGRP